MKKDEKPESAQTEESLTSSSVIPSFRDVEAEYADILSEATEEEKPKRKGKSEPEEKPIQEQVEPEDIEDAVCFPLNALFRRIDVNTLSNIERKAFALSISRLINKYMPLYGNKFKEEFGFLMCTGTIIAVRWKTKDKEDESKKSDSTGKES